MPVYPLGMMSDYALNADGRMRTPLGFSIHDVFHTNINKTWMHLDGMAALESIADRLRLQQAVRDGLPAAVLAEHKLERALELMVFYLFHEISVVSAQRTLENKAFLPLFRAICLARRQKRESYSYTCRAITDQQALLACFWIYRVYTHYFIYLCTAARAMTALKRFPTRSSTSSIDGQARNARRTPLPNPR